MCLFIMNSEMYCVLWVGDWRLLRGIVTQSASKSYSRQAMYVKFRGAFVQPLL